MEFCPKFEDENLSEKFLAKVEFCNIDPWPLTWGDSSKITAQRIAPKLCIVFKSPKKYFSLKKMFVFFESCRRPMF
jgi:hypothetical protein